MRKLIFYIVVFLAGGLIGMLVYRNNWFPVSIYRSIVSNDSIEIRKPWGFFYTPYTVGVPLFSDRIYVDSYGDSELENTYVLQVPRHDLSPKRIVFDTEVIVYRILTDANDNQVFDEWEKTDISINVQGGSCVHNMVVKKVFNNETVLFKGGGPVSSSPLLVKSLNDVKMPYLKVNGVILDDTFGLNLNHSEEK